ncbi:potassium channel family protein [Halorientalis halophila]|uniref:potassium channel family protein n=1 Tax=Halorientalis halophila TaxID=3108499 RepID=UPI003AB2FE22
MQRPSRRTGYYLALVIVLTLLLTVVYNVGMASWENRPQPLYRSLQVVIQSFTTTGYGEDAPWLTPQMNLLAIVMQFTGIGLILTAVDVFAVPWIRDALTPSAPQVAPELDDHVIICEHTPRTDAFIGELEARGRDYVHIESDPETARELYERGYRLIEGDAETTETLANAHIESAMCVVIDAADDRSASIALAVREARPDVRVIALVEDADLAQYHRAAGVDDVLSPRQLLGESLAEHLPTAVTTEIDEGVTIGEDFELVELTISEDSDLAHTTFAEAALRDRFGVNVVGAWLDSDFKTPVDLDDRLEAGTRLLVTGESDQVESLREITVSAVRDFTAQRIVLAGYGDSGRAVYDGLAGSGSRLTVLDIEQQEQVDVVGDARDPDVLEAAGIRDADALVLTVADDTTAVFTTLIVRELNPDLQIIVRANEEEDVEKLYRAGADYVQSLATVSGRMLASTVFEDEEVLTYQTQINVVRLPASGLEGTTLAAEEVRTTTGCTVIAVIRDGKTITRFDPVNFTFEAGDEFVITGTDEAITQFEQQFRA